MAKIRDDFPSLTVHDVTHVDSLWQTGSVLTGEDYELSPLEGFVLGCAFLFHDAVLSYEAAGGKERLRSTREWMDYYADYKARIMNRDLNAEQPQSVKSPAVVLFCNEMFTILVYNTIGLL